MPHSRLPPMTFPVGRRGRRSPRVRVAVRLPPMTFPVGRRGRRSPRVCVAACLCMCVSNRRPSGPASASRRRTADAPRRTPRGLLAGGIACLRARPPARRVPPRIACWRIVCLRARRRHAVGEGARIACLGGLFAFGHATSARRAPTGDCCWWDRLPTGTPTGTPPSDSGTAHAGGAESTKPLEGWPPRGNAVEF